MDNRKCEECTHYYDTNAVDDLHGLCVNPKEFHVHRVIKTGKACRDFKIPKGRR